MKKIVLIFVVLAATLSMSAQTSINKKGAVVYDSGSDTIVAAESNSFIVADIKAPYYYTYSVELEDHSGGNTAALVVSGSLDGVNFKTLVSDSYSGVGSDTVFIGQITANPISYPVIKFTVTPSDTILLKSVHFQALQIK